MSSDTVPIVVYLVGMAILMALSAFFSASETAFSALTKGEIEKIKKSPFRGPTIGFLEQPRRLFITVLLGNTVVNVAFIVTMGTFVYDYLFGSRNAGAASLVAVLVELVLLLMFGEISPKTYAVRNAAKLYHVIAGPLWFFSILIWPFRRLLRVFTDFMMPMFGISESSHERRITREELRALIGNAREEGAVSDREAEIIRNIVDLGEIEAREAMIPRTEMTSIEVTVTVKEAFEKARESGFSRLPVFRHDVDNICGVFYVKDLPHWVDNSTGKMTIEDMTLDEFLAKRPTLALGSSEKKDSLVRTPFFALETKRLGTLMREMTGGRRQMALLIDEYGGVSGLITVEDIIEEVFGEILDEYDVGDGQTIIRDRHEPGSYEVSGLVSLRTLNKRLKLRLNHEDVDSIGGYVVNLFGDIPSQGDRIPDPVHGFEFEIVRMDGPRVDRVRLRRTAGSSATPHPVVSRIFLLLIGMLPVIAMAASGGSVAFASTQPFLLPVFGSVLGLSLILIGFYAGSETAVVSASRERLEVLAEEGNRAAITVHKLLGSPDSLLATVLVGTNLMTAIAGQAAVILMADVLPDNHGLRNTLTTLAMAFVVLVFCEILPKTIFYSRADTLALKSAPFLRISSVILSPFVFMASLFTKIASPKTSRKDLLEELQATRDELRHLATMGDTEGVIKSDQAQMIESVLELDDTTLEWAMVPLVNVVALPKEASIEEFYAKAEETGYSRIAVFEERVDNIVGVVNVLDVLYAGAGSGTIAKYVREDITYEPRTRRVLSLLPQLQQSRKPLAFVVDEYGGVIGLVTTEDLIEEITGEILDEDDEDGSQYVRRISQTIVECDGKTEIDEINRLFDIEIPEGDYETIAGYVSTIMQRLPKQGEFTETESMRIMILDADLRRIRRVRIQKKPAAPEKG